MRELEMLQLTETEIKKNYNIADAKVTGHSINSKKIKYSFDDMGIKITIEYETETALYILFQSRVAKGEFNNCAFVEFKNLWDLGYEIEDIEPELKKRKLDFGDGKKEE